ncbi:hypothetical protein IM725_03725 [Ramlibacter aquaticus]|uniref:MarR family transcriptional regulator n=1 Tax=Ramlibacter aquaticus TaxID=2780094 RepID=A0ABR9SC89_9BURK|nr:hypothetical protein [Ramlibacter aquaticus]MBE7939682.1 hypothetical protein [Ramlibacter aquaticus]
MQLKKSILGHEELLPGSRALSLRERAVLFFVVGEKTVTEIEAALGAGSRELIDRLLAAGYLEQVEVRQEALQVAESAISSVESATRVPIGPTCEQTIASWSAYVPL